MQNGPLISKPKSIIDQDYQLWRKGNRSNQENQILCKRKPKARVEKPLGGLKIRKKLQMTGRGSIVGSFGKLSQKKRCCLIGGEGWLGI